MLQLGLEAFSWFQPTFVPIRVPVFADREQFRRFLIQQLHFTDPPNFGVYVYAQKFFATYEDSGLGTFAHEILHPLVERNLKDRPQWAMKGIPAFFEKFYGCWKADELTVYWGYQNPWRIQQLEANLTQLDLKQVIVDTDSPAHFKWWKKTHPVAAWLRCFCGNRAGLSAF